MPVGQLVNDVAIDEFANNEPGQVQIKNHTTFHAFDLARTLFPGGVTLQE